MKLGHYDSTSGDFTGIWREVTAVSPAVRNCTTYLNVSSETKIFEPIESVTNSLAWTTEKCHFMRLRNEFSVEKTFKGEVKIL